MDIMTDVVVKIDLKGPESEAKLLDAVDRFAENKESNGSGAGVCDDAPQIMIKTFHDRGAFRKAIIFQDRNDAEAFMYFWRRHERLV